MLVTIASIKSLEVLTAEEAADMILALNLMQVEIFPGRKGLLASLAVLFQLIRSWRHLDGNA
jgi:hypothetical protein